MVLSKEHSRDNHHQTREIRQAGVPAPWRKRDFLPHKRGTPTDSSERRRLIIITFRLLIHSALLAKQDNQYDLSYSRCIAGRHNVMDPKPLPFPKSEEPTLQSEERKKLFFCKILNRDLQIWIAAKYVGFIPLCRSNQTDADVVYQSPKRLQRYDHIDLSLYKYGINMIGRSKMDNTTIQSTFLFAYITNIMYRRSLYQITILRLDELQFFFVSTIRSGTLSFFLRLRCNESGMQP